MKAPGLPRSADCRRGFRRGNMALKSWLQPAMGWLRQLPGPGPRMKTIVWIAAGVVLGISLFGIAAWWLLSHPDFTIKNLPWTSFFALAAAPSVILTWYWRTIHKQKELSGEASPGKSSMENHRCFRLSRISDIFHSPSVLSCISDMFPSSMVSFR
uniref:Uncharacterized protein n=1 Tax=Candidatus Kentrum sp. LFY TaxID=2126342 RepID=A0A450U528_9GAMM|nr:MAG: hypothetical protein BECKLFY1418B_GA0070995_1001106 [Candidatus Kentron sp. LFY]